MTDYDVVRDLFHRLDLPGDGAAVCADEVFRWPPGLTMSLEATRILRQGATLQSFTCDECLEPHTERVFYLDEEASPRVAVIPCTTNGRVFISNDRLRCWRAESLFVAGAVVQALGSRFSPREVVPGRCWSLGVVTLPSGSQPAYLIRGAGWPDSVSEIERRLPGRLPRTFFLLAPAVPVSWQLGGTSISLIECVCITPSGIFDFPIYLARHRETRPRLSTYYAGLGRFGMRPSGPTSHRFQIASDFAISFNSFSIRAASSPR